MNCPFCQKEMIPNEYKSYYHCKLCPVQVGIVASNSIIHFYIGDNYPKSPYYRISLHKSQNETTIWFKESNQTAIMKKITCIPYIIDINPNNAKQKLKTILTFS
jgi:hypothetical protein